MGYWQRVSQKVYGSAARAHFLRQSDQIGGDGEPPLCSNTPHSSHWYGTDPNCVLAQNAITGIVTDLGGGVFNENTQDSLNFVVTCTCEKWSECFAKNLTATMTHDGRNFPKGHAQRIIQYVAQAADVLNPCLNPYVTSEHRSDHTSVCRWCAATTRRSTACMHMASSLMCRTAWLSPRRRRSRCCAEGVYCQPVVSLYAFNVAV